MYALAIFAAHRPERFIRSMYRKVEQVSDERPSMWSRRERHAPSPDKTSNEAQCQTGKENIEDLEPHDCGPMEPVRRDTNNDKFMQFEQALYHIPKLGTRNDSVK